MAVDRDRHLQQAYTVIPPAVSDCYRLKKRQFAAFT